MRTVDFAILHVRGTKLAVFRCGVVIRVDNLFRDVAARLSCKGMNVEYVDDEVLAKVGRKLYK